MKQICLDCGKEINKYSIRCKQCSNIFNANKRKKVHTCLDCDKELSKTKYKRCASCARKYYIKHNLNKISGHYSSHYRDGRSLKKYNCIKCCSKITWQTFIYGSKLCKICSDIDKSSRLLGVNNPNYNNHKLEGKNNPNWYGGISKEGYSYKFNDNLKETIRHRDNYQCQNCGMTEEEHLIVFGSVLHVHHIDYNKKNCIPNNLITTCHNCNIRANYNRSYWQSFYNAKIEIIYSKIV